MPRQIFHFFAGEQHLQFESSNVLDAWWRMERYAETYLVAAEFRSLPIKAFDSEGTEIATRVWKDWHAALMRDTYGDNWEADLDRAASLI